jgi:plastocyanin
VKFDITIHNFQFNPMAPNVTAGTTVVWTNNDTVPHSVVAYDGSFDSGALQPGESFEHTFTNAGLVAYHCGVHTTMRGTIDVQGEAPPQGAM